MYPVTMPRRSGSVLVTASYGHYGQRAAKIGPDRVYRIPLPVSDSVPFFQRRHGPYCAKPTRIRSGWPDQGLAKRIWSRSKPVCRNHRARFLAGRNRPATGFPLRSWFRSSTDGPDDVMRNQPGSDLVLADSVGFWPNGTDPEASRCARLIRPASGQHFQSDPVRIEEEEEEQEGGGGGGADEEDCEYED